MKKVFLGLLAAWLLCVPAFAHPPITVYVNGEKISFDQPPIIQNDYTLVPMRKIFEALDAQVIWDEAEQTVLALHQGDSILLRIGEAGLYKNGALVYTMPVPAQLLQERTLVPLRAVAESLGASVGWDGIDYVVTIQASGKPSSLHEQQRQDGYTSSVLAPDGTEVLRVSLQCEEAAGQTAVNAAMAEAVFAQGSAFLQSYQAQALQAYAKNPKDFQPYSCAGAYRLMRNANGYTSFLGTVSSYIGETEQVQTLSHTYAWNSGKECALSDLVADSRADLQELWYASFTALIEADKQAFYSDAASRLQQNLAQVQFYLTEDEIVFYLSPGSIAPAATGTVSFALTYRIEKSA